MSRADSLGSFAGNVTAEKISLSNIKLTPSSAPSSPVQGDMYLDSSDNNLKIYTGNFWKNIVFASTISATGGTITEITDSGVDYRVHTFTTSGFFTVTSGSGEVEYLVVAGGGPGGSGFQDQWENGGGGGAGGYRSSVVGESSGGGASAEAKLSLTPGSYTVIVGAGGAPTPNNTSGRGTNGEDSVFSTITSVGGGAGGSNDAAGGGGNVYPGIDGGSGGGSSWEGAAGSGTTGQGFDGGIGKQVTNGGGGGGGGGAGSAGLNASDASGANGGSGVVSNITGSPITRAGGGGGGNDSNGSSGSGGSGGGGDGALNIPDDGDINTGSGGGGSGTNSGGAGGSGIVIVRYPI